MASFEDINVGLNIASSLVPWLAPTAAVVVGKAIESLPGEMLGDHVARFVSEPLRNKLLDRKNNHDVVRALRASWKPALDAVFTDFWWADERCREPLPAEVKAALQAFQRAATDETALETLFPMDGPEVVTALELSTDPAGASRALVEALKVLGLEKALTGAQKERVAELLGRLERDLLTRLELRFVEHIKRSAYARDGLFYRMLQLIVQEVLPISEGQQQTHEQLRWIGAVLASVQREIETLQKQAPADATKDRAALESLAGETLQQQQVMTALLEGIAAEQARQGAVQATVAAGVAAIEKRLPTLYVLAPGTTFNLPTKAGLGFIKAGRERDLAQTLAALTPGARVAITGEPGMGKSLTALKAAHTLRAQNPLPVFRLLAQTAERSRSATDTQTNLRMGLESLARHLKLVAEDAAPEDALAAAQAFLNSDAAYLLLIDNADELEATSGFLPKGPNGRVLLTSRRQPMPRGVREIALQALSADESAAFLSVALARPLSATETATAQEIGREVGGLPQVLDLAAASVRVGSSDLSGWLSNYRANAVEVLMRRPPGLTEYPDPAYVAFTLTLDSLERASPEGLRLLTLLSHLSPDAIPHEILDAFFKETACDPEACLVAIRERSLLREVRVEDVRSWSLHRVTAAVALSRLVEDTSRRESAESAIGLVSAATPFIELKEWPLCERLLPHWRACAVLIAARGIASEVAARLLNQAGYYLNERAQYGEVEPLYRRALGIYEAVHGPQHPDVATSLNNLALLLYSTGRYPEAEPLYRRALGILEAVHGPQHPLVAGSLNNLALLLKSTGRYPEAEPLYRRALGILEAAYGPDHPEVATDLNNLAALLESTGRYPEAEPLYKRALAILLTVLGPDHPNTKVIRGNLEQLLREMGQQP